jgi:hypothetical protein
MFMAGLCADNFIRIFKDLVKRAFKPRKVSSILFISDIKKIIVFYLTDNLYFSESLKAALK